MRFGFLVNEVLTGLRRNVTMTVAMILTTAISIGLFGGGLLVVRLADQSRNIYLDRVETQVFLTDDVSANRTSHPEGGRCGSTMKRCVIILLRISLVRRC